MQRPAAPHGPSGAQRMVGLGAVLGLHLLLLAALTTTGMLSVLPRAIVPATLILAPPRPPPKLPVIQPALTAPALPELAAPEIRLAAPPPPIATHAVARAAPAASPPASHFGAGSGDGLGLGLDVAAGAGGGGAARGTLAGFEAAVRARVLAARRQPSLAWDRRNTCVVGYRVTVGPGGALAGFSLDPCGVPEINAAAGDAIRRAAPFPSPPGLGAATSEVHGTLIFHP